MLQVVGPVAHVQHPLGVAVAKVGRVGRPVVNHTLVHWIGRYVGKDASRQAGNDLLYLELKTVVQDIVVDQQNRPLHNTVVFCYFLGTTVDFKTIEKNLLNLPGIPSCASCCQKGRPPWQQDE